VTQSTRGFPSFAPVACFLHVLIGLLRHLLCRDWSDWSGVDFVFYECHFPTSRGVASIRERGLGLTSQFKNKDNNFHC